MFFLPSSFNDRGILFTLLVVAWSLSVVSVANCTFLEAKSQFRQGHLGLFTYEVGSTFTNAAGYCARYDEEYFDIIFSSAAQSARAFGVLAALLSGFVLLLDLSFELFWEWPVVTMWRTCVVLLLLSFLFQSLTFLFFLNANCETVGIDCTLGAAGYLSAISAVLFASSSIMMGCIARPPTKPYLPISDMRDRHSTKLRYVSGDCIMGFSWSIFLL